MTLLDTHVILWLRTGSERLGSIALKEINQAWHLGELAVCSISFWEIAMLKRKRRIELSANLEHWYRAQIEQGVIEIPINGPICLRAASLVNFHADPADRLIVATALEGHRLITADERILDWDGELDRLAAFS